MTGRCPPTTLQSLAVPPPSRLSGRGLGIPDRAGKPPLDLTTLDASLDNFREANPHLQLWLEPGRFLVAQAGVIRCWGGGGIVADSTCAAEYQKINDKVGKILKTIQ